MRRFLSLGRLAPRATRPILPRHATVAADRRLERWQRLPASTTVCVRGFAKKGGKKNARKEKPAAEEEDDADGDNEEDAGDVDVPFENAPLAAGTTLYLTAPAKCFTTKEHPRSRAELMRGKPSRPL